MSQITTISDNPTRYRLSMQKTTHKLVLLPTKLATHPASGASTSLLTLNASAEQRNLFADNHGDQPKHLCSSPRGYFQDTCSVRALVLSSLTVATTCCQLQLAQPQHPSRCGVCCCCHCPDLALLVCSLAPSEACQLAGT